MTCSAQDKRFWGLLFLILSLLCQSRGSLLVSELMYHPPHDFLEYIEIHNPGQSTVDLTGWSIPAIKFEFQEGASVKKRIANNVPHKPPGIIDPGSFIVVAYDRDRFLEYVSYSQILSKGLWLTCLQCL